MKECNTCSETKPLTRFKAYDNGYGLKYRGSCKDCRNSKERGTRSEASARYYYSNLDKMRSDKKEYYYTNQDRLVEYSRQYYADNKEEVSLRSAAKTYGIGLEEVKVMRSTPCAICGAAGEGQQKAMHIDHCHTTGKVRGTLCHHCNTALGLLKEDTARLDKMKEYINAYK